MHATEAAYAPTTEHQVAEMRHSDRLINGNLENDQLAFVNLLHVASSHVLQCRMVQIISSRLLLTITQKVQRTAVGHAN